jgi:hypothetical protein
MITSKLTYLIKTIHLILISCVFAHYISRLIESMETLNVGDPIDLWESWNNHGKFHISYSVCVNMSTLSIYGAHGSKECIIVSSEIIFVSDQERALFSSTPMLQNFGSTIGKS